MIGKLFPQSAGRMRQRAVVPRAHAIGCWHVSRASTQAVTSACFCSRTAMGTSLPWIPPAWYRGDKAGKTGKAGGGAQRAAIRPRRPPAPRKGRRASQVCKGHGRIRHLGHRRRPAKDGGAQGWWRAKGAGAAALPARSALTAPQASRAPRDRRSRCGTT